MFSTMFTGIIEHVGTVIGVKTAPGHALFTVDAGPVSGDVKPGDSVALNGVCLTVRAVDGSALTFDAVPETMARTTLETLRVGSRVNLERAAQLGMRMGGHLVQGHVDGTGLLESIQIRGNGRVIRVKAEERLLRYVAEKGSIAVDGISLTVAQTFGAGFAVWIVPYTWDHTTLRYSAPGDRVNLEVDLIARYIERLALAGRPASGVSVEGLAAAGFDE